MASTVRIENWGTSVCLVPRPGFASGRFEGIFWALALLSSRRSAEQRGRSSANLSLIFLAGIASSRRACAHVFEGLSSVGMSPFSSRALLGDVLLRLCPAVALFVRPRLHGPVLTSAFMLRILFRAAALLYGLVWSRLG